MNNGQRITLQKEHRLKQRPNLFIYRGGWPIIIGPLLIRFALASLVLEWANLQEVSGHYGTG